MPLGVRVLHLLPSNQMFIVTVKFALIYDKYLQQSIITFINIQINIRYSRNMYYTFEHENTDSPKIE